MDFASIVREERTSKGLTQGELAERAGLSLHAVWEAERGNGSVAVLAALLSALDVRITGVPRDGSWGERVRTLRKRRGWSQERLAERAGVSPMAINRLENGNARTATLSAALGVLAPGARVGKPKLPNWGEPSSRDERYTPPDVVERISRIVGGIELDPCGHPDSPVAAERYLTKERDALKEPWTARSVYVNPPYSQTGKFIKKSHDEWHAGRASTVLALIPAYMNFGWFFQYVVGVADAYILRHRISFIRPGLPLRPAPFGSLLIVYGGDAALRRRVLAEFDCVRLGAEAERGRASAVDAV